MTSARRAGDVDTVNRTVKASCRLGRDKAKTRERAIFQMILATLMGYSMSVISAQEPQQTNPLSDSQWETVREQVGLLDQVAYLPSLLPVIMKHRDTLELTDEQVAAFREWRQLHYQDMVDLMNEIIQQRIALSRSSLAVSFTGEDILLKQKEIFRLQEQLMRIRLSCRQKIVETFSANQWENFAFILEEYPRYAGLLDDWQ